MKPIKPQGIDPKVSRLEKKELCLDKYYQDEKGRIGKFVNWVSFNKVELKLEFSTLITHWEELEPVELTEEILLRFGFVGNGKDYVLEDYIFLELEDGDWDDCCMDFYIETADMKKPYYITCVSSLHQLQNLYFALCGKELELKQKQ